MPSTDVRPLGRETRANWIRLRTMILLRWVAISGQLTAIAASQYLLDLQLDMGLCYLVIGAAAISNLVAMFVFPENKRLSEAENFAMVMFDLLQLSALLFLTGGLNNPFALLVLGPVTVSATVLSLRSTVILGATALVMVSLLGLYHFPLRTEQGYVLEMARLFIFGNWIALVIAIVFISLYAVRVTTEIHSMSDALAATQMALAREQKLTDLGGVVAAAAHELGTPLATIKLASSELSEELADRPELREDALLIRDQADRCRDILRDMGRAGKDDLHMRQAPLMTVLEDAADPHRDRGKTVNFDCLGDAAEQPTILRKPEIIHGLRNLIQNAVDFARSEVWIEADWTEDRITLRIIDDGQGFPLHVLGRIGDPFVRRRRTAEERRERPGYEGMGLGLFIAKTLLERSGAQLNFANGRDPSQPQEDGDADVGAIVEVNWRRHSLDAKPAGPSVGLGQNKPISA